MTSSGPAARNVAVRGRGSGAGPAPDRDPARPAGLRRLAALPPRAELTAILLLGLVGGGLVFLVMRQTWAQVRTPVPAPLPTSVVRDSGENLIPFADALDIAALASLAAVLATRGVARRVTGVVLAALGAGIIAAVAAGVSGPAALAAAAQAVGPAGGSGAGTAPGSATDGTASGGTAVPDVGGFRSHAVLTAATWQSLAIIGALALIAAGVLVTWRAARLPVMSSRYDSPAGAAPGHPAPLPPEPGPDAPGDTATMWESLSRGDDPTARPPAPDRP
jgi:Tryptophan-associated transmembrane protein (Trp_oprn_chp)